MGDRITPVDWKTLKKVFEASGFVHERTVGSHISMIKAGVLRPVIIPKYKEIDRDIILSNMRTAGLSRAEYLALLKSVS